MSRSFNEQGRSAALDLSPRPSFAASARSCSTAAISSSRRLMYFSRSRAFRLSSSASKWVFGISHAREMPWKAWRHQLRTNSLRSESPSASPSADDTATPDSRSLVCHLASVEELLLFTLEPDMVVRYLLMGACGLDRESRSFRLNSLMWERSVFMLRTCSESTATSSGSTITSASFAGASCLRVASFGRFAMTCALKFAGKTMYWWKSKRSRKTGPSRYFRRRCSGGKMESIFSTTQAEKVSRRFKRRKTWQTSWPPTGFTANKLCLSLPKSQ
mmetsp:Transcript_130182/g.291030  ORF Transcript_130182/g.291030 Transcript_130182/m.291030 type:complete len:274 (+) Transcript_130182:1988-2809(+)